MRDSIVDLAEKVGALTGWDALNEDHPDKLLLNRLSGEAAAELSQAFFECFRTPSGKKVAHILVERFLLQPLTSAEDNMITVGEKGGMQKLVLSILEEMDKGSRL